MTQPCAPSAYRGRSPGQALAVLTLVLAHLTPWSSRSSQTFHMDNAVSGDVSGGRIILHGGRWEVRPKNGAASQPKPPPAESVKEMPGQEGAGVPRVAAISRSGGTVLMRPPKYLLPDGTYAIPTMQDSSIEKVLVLPPTHDTSQAGPVWRPQICEVVKGAAMYINRSPIPSTTPSTPTSRPSP